VSEPPVRPKEFEFSKRTIILIVLAMIAAAAERLAELHKKGILSSEEFAAKKAELLSRL
jgi:hypothetical protein